MRKLKTGEFIKKANAIHGDRYDYSKTDYKNAMIYVIVICPIIEHGEFIIKPNNHTSGRQGCDKCGHKMHIFSTEAFIEKAKAIHGNDRYDYSKSIYTLAHLKRHKIQLNLFYLLHNFYSNK